MGLKCGGPRGVFVWSICITTLRSGDIVANVLQLVGAARGGSDNAALSLIPLNGSRISLRLLNVCGAEAARGKQSDRDTGGGRF